MYWIDKIHWLNDVKYFVFNYFEIVRLNHTYKDKPQYDVVIKTYTTSDPVEFAEYYIENKKL